MLKFFWTTILEDKVKSFLGQKLAEFLGILICPYLVPNKEQGTDFIIESESFREKILAELAMFFNLTDALGICIERFCPNKQIGIKLLTAIQHSITEEIKDKHLLSLIKENIIKELNTNKDNYIQWLCLHYIFSFYQFLPADWIAVILFN